MTSAASSRSTPTSTSSTASTPSSTTRPGATCCGASRTGASSSSRTSPSARGRWPASSGAAAPGSGRCGRGGGGQGSLRRADRADPRRAPAERRTRRGRLDARAATMTRTLSRAGGRVVTGGLGFIGSHLAARARRPRRRGHDRRLADPRVRRQPVQRPRDRRPGRHPVHGHPRPLGDPAPGPGQGPDLQPRRPGLPIDSMTDPETDLEINGRRSSPCSRRSAPTTRRRRWSSPRRGSSTAGRASSRSTEEHPMVPVDVNGINLVAAERFHLLYTDVYGSDGLAAAHQHLRPAPADEARPPGLHHDLHPPRPRRRGDRSSATANSCATSPTSTMRSRRSSPPPTSERRTGRP